MHNTTLNANKKIPDFLIHTIIRIHFMYKSAAYCRISAAGVKFSLELFKSCRLGERYTAELSIMAHDCSIKTPSYRSRLGSCGDTQRTTEILILVSGTSLLSTVCRTGGEKTAAQRLKKGLDCGSKYYTLVPAIKTRHVSQVYISNQNFMAVAFGVSMCDALEGCQPPQPVKLKT